MSSLFFGSDRDQALIVKRPSERSSLLLQLFGDLRIVEPSETLTRRRGEQSDVLVASFSLLAEHVPTVVNLSM